MPGIEPGASYMQSMRSTTELHPLTFVVAKFGLPINLFHLFHWADHACMFQMQNNELYPRRDSNSQSSV